ncbi:MAG: hypothetical protein COA79_21655 [Planctomycetota bacterium]|nr:MAG: hypothetical protein COA79_21655 [Planctomycetota bacterium]
MKCPKCNESMKFGQLTERKKLKWHPANSLSIFGERLFPLFSPFFRAKLDAFKCERCSVIAFEFDDE